MYWLKSCEIQCYCEGDSVSGDSPLRVLATPGPDCNCSCARRICVRAFMKGVISCMENKRNGVYVPIAIATETVFLRLD